ncbi:MAG: Uma2 family endonuclease [Richelia sp. RM2_1_2]|nr:Uma2 family endonuclease [Richelia sp. SM2_1_7]NJM19936.1 Uma2 family endonuclease [Richelia sp. SM1_7_0]NJN06990.1 Uma2 family endonuclease [Richelia sp. RM1_1_1]NJO30168.1 Uma2 family endonuclease [Richelia sp. SL_2_1]NJO60193.1 Uma2 family endonuclease [Richelia sp. RM2_1_2]
MVKQTLIDTDDGFYIPDANQLVTENDIPVDNFASEKQQRLLVGSLYSSLQNQTFLAAANVGVYYTDLKPAIVPDVFLSLNAQVPENWWEKHNRCYMIWRFGKPPEVAIEIVSNKVGDELGEKLKIYEHMRASYYVVYDPTNQISEETLRIYELRGMRYYQTSETWLEQVGLGLTLWTGEFEARQDSWLRWCHQDGTVLLTGDERAQTAENRAKTAEQRAQTAEQRAAQLAEKLREMGINPDTM